jgi:hypothetical protein
MCLSFMLPRDLFADLFRLVFLGEQSGMLLFPPQCDVAVDGKLTAIN